MRYPYLKKQLACNGAKVLFSLLVCWLVLTPEAQSGCVYSKPLQATISNNTNILSWSTMSEENNDFFVVERSKDGLVFELAVMMEGAGDSDGEKNYRFVDISTDSERTFYRLMQVDFDGTTTMTHTLIVTSGPEARSFDITAMSTSTTDRYFSLILDSAVDHEMGYRVMNLEGKVQKEGDSQLIKGTNALSIDLDGLEVGTYQFALKVKDQEEVLNIRKVDSKELPDMNLARKNNKN
ncbi:MAG: hypothetical protein AAF990_01330 [Bacteroidota bacterium]